MKKYLRTVKSWFVKSPSVYNPKPIPKTTHLEIVWLAIMKLTLTNQDRDGWFSSKELILEVNEFNDLTPLQVYRVISKLQRIGKLTRQKSLSKALPNLYKFTPTV